MKIDNDNGTITFRQSWINENLLCAERSRRSLTDPDLFVGNDAAIMGTGLHAYVETRLCGGSVKDAVTAAFHALDREFAFEHTNPKMTDQQVYAFLPRMCASFERDLLPHVPPGGQTEVPFNVPLMEWNGWSIRLHGTIDYADPSGKLWDWKTSGMEYKPWEKKRWAVQPTAYALGAVDLGLSDYPVQWEYAIVLKSPIAAPKTQRVAFTRTAGSAEWLKDLILSILNTTIRRDASNAYLTDGPWLKNDQHALCSRKWCPVYAECKGRWLEV